MVCVFAAGVKFSGIGKFPDPVARDLCTAMQEDRCAEVARRVRKYSSAVAAANASSANAEDTKAQINKYANTDL